MARPAAQGLSDRNGVVWSAASLLREPQVAYCRGQVDGGGPRMVSPWGCSRGIGEEVSYARQEDHN